MIQLASSAAEEAPAAENATVMQRCLKLKSKADRRAARRAV